MENQYIISLHTTYEFEDVLEFIELLGYEKLYRQSYVYFDKSRQETLCGVKLHITREPFYDEDPKFENERSVLVILTTESWESISDYRKLTDTIKKILERFQGTFNHFNSSIKGFHLFNGIERHKAESGCYNAYFEFRRNIAVIDSFIEVLDTNKSIKSDVINDTIISTYDSVVSLGIPYLITVMEVYFRQTYVSLLTYHTNKRDIFKSARILTEELIEIDVNGASPSKIIARFKNFQNVNEISKSFSQLDERINFKNMLNKHLPSQSYLSKLEELIETRHNIIHSFWLYSMPNTDNLKIDLVLVKAIVDIFYSELCRLHHWSEN